MNYRKDVDFIIDYIESNITSELSTDMLAELIGYSAFHFSRIFTAYKDMNVMEYVRYRRLSLAARAIFNGQKITDAAFLYGFKTVSGFSKAFKRQFGCTPSEYQGQIIRIENQLPLFSKEAVQSFMRLVEISSFAVAGYPIGIPDPLNASDHVALWADIDEEEEGRLELLMYAELNPSKHAEFGICYPDETGLPQYVLALHLDNEYLLRPHMKKIMIQDGMYGVFTTPPVDLTDPVNEKFAMIIRTLWKSIFMNFFDQPCEFEYDNTRLDFEYYDERTHSEVDPHMEIWIPVKIRK